MKNIDKKIGNLFRELPPWDEDQRSTEWETKRMTARHARYVWRRMIRLPWVAPVFCDPPIFVDGRKYRINLSYEYGNYKWMTVSRGR